MKESTAWVFVVLLLGCVLCFAIVNFCHVAVTTTAMEQGYSQKLLPGTSQVYWVKCGDKEPVAE